MRCSTRFSGDTEGVGISASPSQHCGVLRGPEEGRDEGRPGSLGFTFESTLFIWGKVQAAVLDGSLPPICHLRRFVPKLFSFSSVIMCLWAMEPADASWKQMHCRLLHSCFPKSFQDRRSSRETLQLAPFSSILFEVPKHGMMGKVGCGFVA